MMVNKKEKFKEVLSELWMIRELLYLKLREVESKLKKIDDEVSETTHKEEKQK